MNIVVTLYVIFVEDIVVAWLPKSVDSTIEALTCVFRTTQPSCAPLLVAHVTDAGCSIVCRAVQHGGSPNLHH